MKVLKPGRTKGWKRRCTCQGCDAELEVTDKDCRLVTDARDGNYHVAVCPECGRALTIDARLVP
jgi:RNase P subunit RPR2